MVTSTQRAAPTRLGDVTEGLEVEVRVADQPAMITRAAHEGSSRTFSVQCASTSDRPVVLLFT